MEQKYDFTQAEEKMQRLWRDYEIYKYDTTSDRKIYSIDTPPPTVSGSLHIGHVFSYAQAEMIARYHRMQGENVYYPFGFDDNGLPTERLVEREKKIYAKNMKRSEFAKECYEITNQYEEEFRKMWEALGLSVDWSLKYKTIDPECMRMSQRSFLELAKSNKAYRKESPVLWCTTCQTSIAQAELETVEFNGMFHYLRFQTKEGDLIIATTRPELLYGCVCLFVHPEDERYKKYIGEKAIVPLYHFEIPILQDDTVDPLKGTGVVMCATYGDTTDVEWCEKYFLPYKNIITSSGQIAEEVPNLGGLKVLEARKKVIELLKESKELLDQEELTHMVATHERCGKEVEILPSKQWYIDVLSEKERYVKAADEINWYPKSMKHRYLLWVENLKWDWCISRQRYFGVPFPVWYCKKCGNPIYAKEEQLPINPLEASPIEGCSCGCSEFLPETAVFDTWATSSITPLLHAKYKEKGMREDFLPMTMRTQSHDIIRTWAFYTIIKSLYHTGKLPWKNIMISGFVLAKRGEKISKSKNNGTLSPMKLIQTHSADALRYWCANVNLGTDTFFSEEELKIAKRFLIKLWNVSKFALFHLKDFSKETKEHLEVEYEQLTNLNITKEKACFKPYDLYILCRLHDITRKAKEYLDKYEVGLARKVIDDFFWKEFCDDYIEVVKERLYQPEKHGVKERQSAQYAVYKTLYGLLKLYGIYVPHITEFIYQEYFRQYESEISLHRTLWESKIPCTSWEEFIRFGNDISVLVGEVRKYKSERGMSMKDEISTIAIRCSYQQLSYYKQTEQDIKACTNAKKLVFIPLTDIEEDISVQISQ